jgi:thymidylate synthase (FAD)
MEKRNEVMTYDWQKVKLVAITQPDIDNEQGIKINAEEFIAYCARVSNKSNQMNVQTANKLLKYCITNNHWSIFEMVSLTMEIETTRDIGRQILRHRSFSFQEFSQRYAESGEEFPDKDMRECRLQDMKNRQNSLETDNDMLRMNWLLAQTRVQEIALREYNWAIKAGIAKEVARSILAEGLTMSRIYMSGTLRSWIHYCQLRMENGTQKEHQDIADKCWNILLEKFKFLKDLKNE